MALTKNTKIKIVVNSIMLLIALYTYISIYKPSILHFIDSDYVNGEYVSKGGDNFFDGMFLQLFHYVNLLAFGIINIVFIINGFIKKQKSSVLIAILSIIFMMGIHFWINNITDNKPIKIQENIIESKN